MANEQRRQAKPKALMVRFNEPVLIGAEQLSFANEKTGYESEVGQVGVTLRKGGKAWLVPWVRVNNVQVQE